MFISNLLCIIYIVEIENNNKSEDPLITPTEKKNETKRSYDLYIL